jgi:hypothetical protein
MTYIKHFLDEVELALILTAVLSIVTALIITLVKIMSII